MSITWSIILLLYALGWLFEPNDRRQIATQICFMTCLTCVLLVRFPEYNFSLPSIGFFLIDFIGFIFLLIYGFRVLSLVFCASLLSHAGAAVSYLIGFHSFFEIYNPIMVFINIVVLGVLFCGSRGFDLVLELYRILMDVMPDSHHRKKMRRLQNELYNCELLRDIKKDFS